MLEVVKVGTADLEPGMYVSGLDRPWVGTPFLLQGFKITSDEEMRLLQEHCQHVFIDIRKSEQKQARAITRRRSDQRPRVSRQALFPRRDLTQYQDAANWNDEFPRAEHVVT